MLEKRLKEETLKMLEKIKEQRRNLVSVKRKDLLKNIDAYISDTEYFLKKSMLIEAFEAIVWAWAWLEILEQLGYLRKIK